jgi:hypothetical protein
MVGEQTQLAESFRVFSDKLEESFDADYHIAVVTTGMQSKGCPPCDPPFIPGSCLNETGENGRFQDRIGKNIGTISDPVFTFRSDPACRVVTPANKHCFYDETSREGIALVGVNGCGYEKGLAPMRRALEDDLLNTYNSNFLRDDATLGVIVISDEEDCGEVGDVTENLGSAMGNICYFAAKAIGPEGETSHPDDPNQKTYDLTPVEDYYDFLMGLKNNRKGMVKFAAIVGVNDVAEPSGTTTEYTWNVDVPNPRWDVDDACVTQGCPGRYCFAKPGTRYIKMASMFGLCKHGFVDTICQSDFSDTMQMVAGFMSCPEEIGLKDSLSNPELATMVINGQKIPRYSCNVAAGADLLACSGPDDTSCPQGADCLESWTYQPADGNPYTPGGKILFADHCHPCKTFADGDDVKIQLVLE